MHSYITYFSDGCLIFADSQPHTLKRKASRSTHKTESFHPSIRQSCKEKKKYIRTADVTNHPKKYFIPFLLISCFWDPQHRYHLGACQKSSISSSQTCSSSESAFQQDPQVIRLHITVQESLPFKELRTSKYLAGNQLEEKQLKIVSTLLFLNPPTSRKQK